MPGTREYDRVKSRIKLSAWVVHRRKVMPHQISRENFAIRE